MRTFAGCAAAVILMLVPGSAPAQQADAVRSVSLPADSGEATPGRRAPGISRSDGTRTSIGTEIVAAKPYPEFEVSPTAIVFDDVTVGTQVFDTLLVANFGQILLRVDSVVTPGAQVVVDPGDLKVVPRGSEPVVVSYMPAQAETLEGYLVFYHDAPGSPDSVSISASAVGRAVLVLETPEIDFGAVTVSETSHDTVRISNAGSAALSIDSVTSTVPEISAETGTLLIGVGETDRIAVEFTPVEEGLKEGELHLWHNGESSPGIVVVRGTGTAPPLFEVRPDSILIGAVELGQDAVRTAMILNAGGSPVRIDSIACAVEGFEILPDTLELGAGDSASVTIHFTPTRVGVFAGEARFYHNAASGISSIYLEGEGAGVPGFTLGKTSLDFGTVLLGQTARDSVMVTNPGSSELRVDSVVASTPEFTAHPASGRLPAGGVCWFVVEYTPPTGGIHEASLLFWHNASAVPVAIGLSGTAIAPPPAPVLASPDSGQEGLPNVVDFLWRQSPEATAYRLELAPDTAFVRLILSDSLGQDTSLRVEQLAYNTTYYWRASARNLAGWGPPSEAKTFRTVPTVPMSTSVHFPAEAPGSSSYRLVGIPGTDRLTIGQLFQGRQKTDWRIYRDNGAAANYLVELTEAFQLCVGEGYWALKRGELGVARTLTMPEVQPDGTVNIPLHLGPNIITNPLDRPVSWADIVAANGSNLLGDYPITFEGGSYREVTILEPFKGYYIRNYQNLVHMTIPYPFEEVTALAKSPGVEALWTIQIDFEGDTNVDQGTVLGVADGARDGRDIFDRWKPGPALDLCHLALVRSDLDSDFPYLRADIRSSEAEGHVWDLELRNPRRAEGTILIEGAQEVPAELSILLVNLQETEPVDLRVTPGVPLGAGAERVSLKIIVGSPEYASRELSGLLPQELALLQNYPNPFNPVTAIPFTLPQAAVVRLEVVSLLGQTVATLVNGPMAAGLHTVHWNGTDDRGVQLSSGVYFSRLTAERAVVGIRKLVLLK